MVTIAKASTFKAEDHLPVSLNACKELYVPANSILQLSIAEVKCITAEHIHSQCSSPKAIIGTMAAAVSFTAQIVLPCVYASVSWSMC